MAKFWKIIKPSGHTDRPVNRGSQINNNMWSNFVASNKKDENVIKYLVFLIQLVLSIEVPIIGFKLLELL